MKYSIILFFAFLICSSCTNSCNKKPTITPVETEKVTEAPEEEIQLPEEEPDILEVPEDFASYLETHLKNYKIVERANWLSEEYLEMLPRGTRPRYSDDIFIRGDFNGDGEEDYATFLVNSKGRVTLYAFHRQGDNFKRFKVSDEGSPDILGAGLVTGDYGFVIGDNKESSGLQYNTINYLIYEKTETVYYWDGRKYRQSLNNN